MLSSSRLSRFQFVASAVAVAALAALPILSALASRRTLVQERNQSAIAPYLLIEAALSNPRRAILSNAEKSEK